MEDVNLYLSVLIVVLILYLLYTSGYSVSVSRESESKSVSEGLTVANSSDMSPADKKQFYSTDGAGPLNRQLASQYNELQELGGYDDYSEVAAYMSLEPEVFKSHQEYSKDINRSTSGASTMAIRSDANDPVPVRGLRRPNYHDVYSSPEARVESSEYPDQMYAKPSYQL